MTRGLAKAIELRMASQMVSACAFMTFIMFHYVPRHDVALRTEPWYLRKRHRLKSSEKVDSLVVSIVLLPKSSPKTEAGQTRT
jgi:hypothetical protein